MSDDLARRAVACRHWRWLPGMRLLVGRQGAPYRYVTADYAPPEGDDVACTGPRLPDLDDPATVGCLLALVREAWDWPNAFACHDEIGWYVPNGQTGCSVEWQIEASDGERHDTEAAALVAALEAAP